MHSSFFKQVSPFKNGIVSTNYPSKKQKNKKVRQWKCIVSTMSKIVAFRQHPVVCACACVSIVTHQPRPDQTDMIHSLFSKWDCSIIRLPKRLFLSTHIAISVTTNFSSHCLYSLRDLIFTLCYVYIVESSWISRPSMCMRERGEERLDAHRTVKCFAKGHNVKMYEWRDGISNMFLASKRIRKTTLHVYFL